MTRIGKYEIQSEIGEGAFGKVFRAYDPVTRRDVAIKVLLAENDPDILARFFLEVQATAKLKHKNIVTIYDFNEAPPFIVMELLEGENLKQIITHQQSLTILDKARILCEAAEGLACAHNNGIIHRDIKPANIMVQPNGEVKIMDFGIARVSGETQARRTRQGDLIGTISYMSPERIQGAEADPSSDIFSLGAVGYELITGNHPFAGKDYATVLYKITAADPPDIRSAVPQCPQALQVVLERALAKDPESRYQNIEDVLFDLKPVLFEMAQQQAAPVMREVHGLIDAGQFHEAMERVRRVLELDPTNREARGVHDSLQKQQRLKQVRTKVDALLRDGEAQLEQRQFSKAIQCFEMAVRLDAANLRAAELLTLARAALEANRQASRLLSEARREMLAGNLDNAFEFARQALQADPHHHDAEQLCETLGAQVEEHNRHLRLEKGLHRAEELLGQGDFNGARTALAAIEAEADPDIVRDLRARIGSEEAEKQRRAREQRVQLGIVTAKQQMQAGQLASAGETLRALVDEFPDATAASRLLATIREHLEAQRQSEAIGKLTQEAGELLQSQEFAAARAILESGLQTYRSDAGLQRLLDRTIDLERAHERSLAISRILSEARSLQEDGKTAEALATLKQAPPEYGHDTAILGLKRQLEFELEQRQYAAALRDAMANGQKLLDSGRFGEAVMALEASSVLYPAEPAFVSLLASARQAQAEHEEQQAAAEIIARVGELGSRQQWKDALQCADEGLKRYPYNAALSEIAARTLESWGQQQKQSNMARRRSMIELAIASGNLPRAVSELQTARQEFPGEQIFEELETNLGRAQVRAQLESLERQVCHTLARGDFEASSRQLVLARGCADQAGWRAACEELERLDSCVRMLQEAGEFDKRQDYPAAEKLLKQLPRNPPKKPRDAMRTEGSDPDPQMRFDAVREALDHRAAELLKHVAAQRGSIERSRRLEGRKKEIRELIDRGALQEARVAIDELRRDEGADAELGSLQEALERQQQLTGVLAKLTDLEQRKQFGAALETVEGYLRGNPENEALLKITERLRQAALNQVIDTARAGLARNDLQACAGVLEDAKPRWERDPRWQEVHEELGKRQALESAVRQAELARKKVEQRATAIKSRVDDAQALLDTGHFRGALARVEEALQLYPGEPVLLELQQSIVDKRRQDEQRKILHGIIRDAEKLERAGRVEESCECLERALQRYPQESLLADALGKARQKLARQEELARQRALELDLGRAKSLIERGDLTQAAQLLQGLNAANAADAKVSKLLEELRVEEKRAEGIAALCREIQCTIDAGRFDAAGEAIARGLEKYGSVPQLMTVSAAAENMRARQEDLDRVRDACRERAWRRAAGILEVRLQRDQNDSEFRRLRAEVLENEQADLRRSRRDQARREADQLIQGGRPDDAVIRLRALRGEFPDDTMVRDDLQRAVDAVEQKLKRENYLQGRQRAAAHLRSGQFADAIELLEELLGQFPKDSSLENDLKDAREGHAAQRRRDHYGNERRRAAQLVQTRKFDEAIAILRALLTEFPADVPVEEDLRSATGALELHRRREALDREVSQLERLYRQGDAAAVLERASRLSPEMQDARVRELLDWARKEVDRGAGEREREPADSLRRKRLRRMTIAGTAVTAIAVAATLLPRYFRPAPAHFSLDSNSLSFLAVSGGAPVQKPLSISGNVPGTPWSVQSTQNWLSVDKTQGVTPAQLAVRIDAANLLPNTYFGQLIFTSTDGAANIRAEVKVAVRPDTPTAGQSDPQRNVKKEKKNERPKEKGGPGEDPRQAAPQVIPPPPPALPPPPPEAPDCRAISYTAARNGTVTYSGASGLAPGGTLDIDSRNDLDGALPKCRITVKSSTAGIVIAEQPQFNVDGWKVKVKNVSGSSISEIKLTWNVN